MPQKITRHGLDRHVGESVELEFKGKAQVGKLCRNYSVKYQLLGIRYGPSPHPEFYEYKKLRTGSVIAIQVKDASRPWTHVFRKYEVQL
jgi:hypothetical protein